VAAHVHARGLTTDRMAELLDGQLVRSGVLAPGDGDRRNAAELVGALQRAVQSEPPVLVVDGDPGTRKRLAAMLGEAGWRVAEAEDSRAALERVAQSRPELILLDLMMPEMDGFGFLKALRDRPDGHAIPVAALTAEDFTPQDRARLKNLAVQVIQQGAASMGDLLAEVRRAAGHSPPLAGR